MSLLRKIPIALTLVFGACGPAVSSGRFSEMPMPRAERDIAIFNTKVPTCPYDEIGLVEVHRRTPYTRLQGLIDAMRERAREMGGHAIVGVAVPSTVNANVPSDNTVSISTDGGLRGTVVRFKDDGCRQ